MVSTNPSEDWPLQLRKNGCYSFVTIFCQIMFLLSYPNLSRLMFKLKQFSKNVIKIKEPSSSESGCFLINFFTKIKYFSLIFLCKTRMFLLIYINSLFVFILIFAAFYLHHCSFSHFLHSWIIWIRNHHKRQ